MQYKLTTKEQKIKTQLITAGLSFFQRGLANGSSGNMSAKLADGRILITPTGVSLGRLKEEGMSLLDSNGSLLFGPTPTKEVPLHLACYKANPECQAVIHLHAPYATALSCCEISDKHNIIPAYTPYGLMRYGKIGYISYFKPGSVALAEAVLKNIENHTAILMSNHGLLMTGTNITNAAHNADELEDSCRLFFILQGQNAKTLSIQDQDELLKPKP